MKSKNVGSFVIALALSGGVLTAQVITPVELSDPKTRRLQQRNINALMAIGTDISAHKFPYPFYFSRMLDLDLGKMQAADQRSIHFDVYKGQTVLEITGNYYAAYSAEVMDPYARLKETFLQVILPMLQIEVPHFPDDSEFSAFAIEVSHHVRQKALGVSSERPENVTFIIPVPAAQKLVDAKSDDQRQAAVLEAGVFLNGEPYSLWLKEGAPAEEWKQRTVPAAMNLPGQVKAVASDSEIVKGAPVSSRLTNRSAAELRIVTPDTLAKLDYENQDLIRQLTDGLNREAHFLPYAPAAFIGFRHGAYLQLSVSTQLNTPAQSSRYKLAALAFDDHVSHLLRSVLEYFPREADFDGISISSIVHTTDGVPPVAVEFYFPFRTMRCFVNYDCTGQQLIDSGTVVINGERAGLDLQVAEGKN